MAFTLEDLKEHNSELLKLLTQHLPDMLWVKDIDGKYIYANQATCDGLLMAKDTQEPIGKGDVFFAMREREAHKEHPHWHTFGELCFNSDIDVIRDAKAMKFEEYGNIKGELMYLEVYKAPFFDESGKVIGTVGAGRDITKLKKIQSHLESSLKVLDEQSKKLEYQANHDMLTGLANRVLFMDRLHQSIRRVEREDKKGALLFIDLDHFKEINDSLGHIAGDKILIEFTKRVKGVIEESDTLSRLGGDEFCIILNDITNEEYIVDSILKIMGTTKEAFLVAEHTLYVNMSIGVSVYPNDGKIATNIFKNADAAMYRAKESGRNTYYFYDEEMTKKAMQRVSLETELRKAFLHDELLVYFQPQMNAATNSIVGMEALVRWNHPILGILTPDKFIPLAESSGMIVELDRIVMSKALAILREFEEEGLEPQRVSLNLSIKQLEDEGFLPFVKTLLKKNSDIHSQIEFEVTETHLMKNPERAIELLRNISDLGISISIDDFGTGYSSLTYLKRLPIKKLKIDKSFIDNLPVDIEDMAISKTIISLCETLNLNVIAEGVETEAQKIFLMENGCSFIQGYIYSKPLSQEQMRLFLVAAK